MPLLFFVRRALWAAAVASLFAASSHAHEIVGYYPGWKSDAFPVVGVNAKQLSMVLYAFLDTCRAGRHGNPNPAAGVVAPCAAPDGALVLGEPERDAANLAALVDLKRDNPRLRVLVSVGGWNWSNQFSNIAASSKERAVFAASAVALLRRFRLDGIDIDWEYPTGAGVPCTKGATCERPEDKRNYVLLAQALRSAFDAAGAADGKHYLITIAAGATEAFIRDPQKSTTWLVDLAARLDWINLMAYDYHMPWDPRNGSLAALHGDAADPDKSKGYDDDTAVRRYLDAGVPADKLVLGAPFYGYGWKGCAPGPNGDGLYQHCRGASDGGEGGGAAYPFAWLIKEGYLKAGADGVFDQAGRGYARRWNAASHVPSLYDATSGAVISYEDEASLRDKARYVREKQLRGAMFWELSGDSEHRLGKVLAGELLP